MLQSTTAKKAIQCLPQQARRFSSTPATAALSPYRKASSPQTQQQPARRNVSDTASRSAQAAAAPSPQRTVPSPAFNRDDGKSRDVQPLQPFRQPEMDHSFVGMTGGEIFHEMMLRHGVKHICTSAPWHIMSIGEFANVTTSWLPWRRDSSSLRCYLQQLSL